MESSLFPGPHDERSGTRFSGNRRRRRAWSVRDFLIQRRLIRSLKWSEQRRLALLFVDLKPGGEGGITHTQTIFEVLVDLLLARGGFELGHDLARKHAKGVPRLPPSRPPPFLSGHAHPPTTDGLNAITAPLGFAIRSLELFYEFLRVSLSF